MIKKLINYITEDIWHKGEYEYRSKKVRWAVNQIKVFIYTARGLGEHSVLIRSAALTFYTMTAIVPIAALIFGVAKGFGIEHGITQKLYASFPQYSDVIDAFTEFTTNILERTRGGLIASIGFVMLFWSVMKVFGNAEAAFNNIWEVRKQRKITRKFSDYVTIIFVAPILWMISSSLRMHIQDKLLGFSSSPFVSFLLWLVSILSICIMFTFVYKVMPNTKVRTMSALTAGIIAGIIFQAFQSFYINIQMNLSSYNAIYGSFAAVPLFLIWAQISWQIVLFGCELSFSYQNIRKYESEREASLMSNRYKQHAMLLSMYAIGRAFINNCGPISSDNIASAFNLPVRVVRDVVFELEKSGLIVAVKSEDDKVNLYVPTVDVKTLTIGSVLNTVENTGKYHIGNTESTQLEVVHEAYDRMNAAMLKSSCNTPLMELKIEGECALA